jgi:L-iditol 2-dehydrogenase
VVNGVYRGARVIGVDANPYRADLARRLGAAVVLDPRDPHILEQIRAATGGQGVEAGVDCAGVVAAHRLQIDAAAQRAHLVWVGECQDPTPVQASADLIRKGLTLEGSWHYNLNDIPRVLRVAEEAPGSAQLVTHIYGRDALGEALATSAQQDCGKVLWHPWDEAPGGAVAGLP